MTPGSSGAAKERGDEHDGCDAGCGGVGRAGWLLPAALVGTERAPGWRAALSAAPAPLNGLMAALAATPDEDAAVLLRAAGVLALAARIGADGLALPARRTLPPSRRRPPAGG